MNYNTKIHNKFEIFKIDAYNNTKLVGTAYNLVTNLGRANFARGYNLPVNILLGTGNVAPDPNTPTLGKVAFNVLGVTQTNIFDTLTNIHTTTYTGEVLPAQANGIAFTEIGLSSSSAVSASNNSFSTHAMFKDSQGQQIIIQKTENDRLVVVATVYVDITDLVNQNIMALAGMNLNLYSAISMPNNSLYATTTPKYNNCLHMFPTASLAISAVPDPIAGVVNPDNSYTIGKLYSTNKNIGRIYGVVNAASVISNTSFRVICAAFAYSLPEIMTEANLTVSNAKLLTGNGVITDCYLPPVKSLDSLELKIDNIVIPSTDYTIKVLREVFYGATEGMGISGAGITIPLVNIFLAGSTWVHLDQESYLSGLMTNYTRLPILYLSCFRIVDNKMVPVKVKYNLAEFIAQTGYSPSSSTKSLILTGKYVLISNIGIGEIDLDALDNENIFKLKRINKSNSISFGTRESLVKVLPNGNFILKNSSVTRIISINDSLEHTVINSYASGSNMFVSDSVNGVFLTAHTNAPSTPTDIMALNAAMNGFEKVGVNTYNGTLPILKAGNIRCTPTVGIGFTIEKLDLQGVVTNTILVPFDVPAGTTSNRTIQTLVYNNASTSILSIYLSSGTNWFNVQCDWVTNKALVGNVALSSYVDGYATRGIHCFENNMLSDAGMYVAENGYTINFNTPIPNGKVVTGSYVATTVLKDENCTFEITSTASVR